MDDEILKQLYGYDDEEDYWLGEAELTDIYDGGFTFHSEYGES
jgi:hypothetical protein